MVVSFSPSETSTLGRYATRPTASLLPELQFITCTQIGLALLLPTPGVHICDRDGSKPRCRYAVFKTQISSCETQICSLQNRRSFQNIPVSPPSHDRLNSATFPRAGIVLVALSSRRLYSIPRPYMRSSLTGCLKTCVFHTKWCPFLWSFLAWFQNTNPRFKTRI